jgi:hypothetical protein
MYAWEHQETKKIVEVIRTFNDSDVPPTEEEAKGLTGKWEKIIGGNQTLLKGPNWRGAKGYW